MNKYDAIEAAWALHDYCESFLECKGCVFCLNPYSKEYYKECFFRDGITSPSFWEKFLEAQDGDQS